MRFVNAFILIYMVILFTACKDSYSNLEGIEGPIVQNSSPDILVEEWEYLSPEQISQVIGLNSFDTDNMGIPFGEEPHTGLIIWSEEGFDLYWTELPCAIKPVVMIHENFVIDLFGGKHPPSPVECIAMESIHGFKVTLSSKRPIPSPDEWEYRFRPSEP